LNDAVGIRDTVAIWVYGMNASLKNYFPNKNLKENKFPIISIYCGVAPRGRSIERPLLINGYAYLAVSLPGNGR
jgi:hypothetical protein